MDLQSFQRALSALQETHSLLDVTRFCHQQAEAIGFQHFIYAMRVPTGFSEARVVFANGYPPAWLERYGTLAYAEHDPVLRHCSRSVLPVAWHTVDTQNAQAARIMNEAGDFGLICGASMPVHSPSGELGVLSVAGGRHDRKSRVQAEAVMPFLQLLAPHIHESVRRACAIANAVQLPELTQRERECLRWTADGKTSWEISQLLRTSERTINFHLNNAMAKLDVSNRQHAVAKAVLQGVLHPLPF